MSIDTVQSSQSTQVPAGTWTIDPSHSEVGFTVRHLMTKVRGQFEKFEGTVTTGKGPWRTSLVFSELGDDHPGALVEALREFSSREVNLTRIESRPLRRGLGRYMFFIDLDGATGDEAVGAAIERLRAKAESVRVLGSYPTGAGGGVPGEAA